MKARSGMFLAGMEGIKYRKNELQFEPGDKLYLYTDGVTEAKSSGGELFGEDRLLECIGNLKEQSPEETVKSVKNAVDDFVQNNDQFDDITMLCFKFTGE